MKKILVLLFLLTLSLYAQSADFMEQAKNATGHIVQAIIAHPFLAEIANGTLSKSRFDFYTKQDKTYDWRYSNGLLELASKSDRVDLRRFLIQAANDSTAHWQGPPPKIMTQCPYCQAYSNFELECIRDSFSRGLASIAPCYVVYWTVGNWLKENSVPNNPYQNWIDGNSSPHYEAHVVEFEKFLNQVASNVTQIDEKRMLETYVRSAQFEWHFWDSAYKETSWEPR